MKSLQSRLESVFRFAWMPDLLTSLAAITFIVQIVYYAHSQDSVLDEGLYLLKGYLFATGKYEPYQPYGPWTNKMPLSFLIPGYVQEIFGPGLRTGRYYAVALSILFILGVWIVAKRISGKWGGFAAVSIIALNSGNLELYSMVLSEGLVATMLTWVLVLTMGKNRTLWQILLGTLLLALIPLTRINMSPVFPLVLLYIFWEHGFVVGGLSAIVGVGTFLVGFVWFSPGIIPWWIMWFPERLTPFLNRYRWNYNGGRYPRSKSVSLYTQLGGFFEGIRLHFVSIASVLLTIIYWPKDWRNERARKVVIFLAWVFSILFLLHGWYSIFRSYSPYGFSVYLSFFGFIGVLILVSSLKEWKAKPNTYQIFLAILFLVLILASMFFPGVLKESVFGQTMESILRTNAVQIGDNMLVERAPWKLWEVFKSRFSWSYGRTLYYGSGLMLFILTGAFAWLSYKVINYFDLNIFFEKSSSKFDLRKISLAIVFFGIVFSPSEFLGGGRNLYKCDFNVISSYERAGDLIDEYVMSEDKVYWLGGDTQAVLLSLEGIDLYPQQLNTSFNLRIGGDSEQLAKHGFWNKELDERWRYQADVILLEERVVGSVSEFLSSDDDLTRVFTTSQIGCRPGSNIVILRRIP